MAPTTLWRIEMLGGLRVLRGETMLPHFPTRKTAALLAYLGLHGHQAHPREVLAEIFWPDAEPDVQRHNLRMTLSRLRATFAPDTVLETDRFSVRLRTESFSTDVTEFEAAVARRDIQTARRLYRGPLLAGFYEDWIMVPAARLAALWEETQEWQEMPAGAKPVLLPLALPRFFGCENERQALRDLLLHERLITLTGTGGSGKTRLAREVGHTLAETAFVTLADRTHPEQVPDAIRCALLLPPPTVGFSLAEQVRAAFSHTPPPLLILDNAEHLLERDLLARIVVDLLEAVASLRILVTSRRTLGIPGEVEFPLLPLSTQDSVDLFVDRVRLVRPEFSITDQNQAAIIALCHRLEGIPLALELAAARIGVLGVPEILQRVSERLDFLASSPRLGVPERHQSLRAAFQSSFDLLPPPLQAQFTRLSVFRGGCTVESAAAVAGTDLTTLEELLHWSLLLREEQTDGTLRFRLLEALREFAQETLPASERTALAVRHALYFRDWAERHRSDEASGPYPDYLTRLERQDRAADNVRAALTFCCASDKATDKETGLRLAAAFWTFWYMRNLSDEMVQWILPLLEPTANAEPAAVLWQARARLPLAMGFRERGEIHRFAAQVEEALSVLRLYPVDRHLAYALHLRGLSLADDYQFDEAEATYLQAEALWEAIGDRRNAAATQHNRALVAVAKGDFAHAQSLCTAALTVFRQFSETAWIGVVCMLEAAIYAANGDMPAAARVGAESLACSRLVGYTRGEAEVLRDLSRYQMAQGNGIASEQHALSALSLYRKTGDPRGEATALIALAAALTMRSGAETTSKAQEYLAQAERLQKQYQWATVESLLIEARVKNLTENSPV